MPQPPSWIPGIDGAIGCEPGSSGQTNNSWPVWGGTGLEPGTTVKFDIDGMEYEANVDENGTWDFTPPEALSEGEHEFEMWTEDRATGEQSDRVEWESTVRSSADDRAGDAERVRDWRERGRHRFRELNRPVTGSGTAGGEDLVSTGGIGAPRGSGFEKGTPGASSAQGLEKGNQPPEAASR